jgi:hypothetical protein
LFDEEVNIVAEARTVRKSASEQVVTQGAESRTREEIEGGIEDEIRDGKPVHEDDDFFVLRIRQFVMRDPARQSDERTARGSAGFVVQLFGLEKREGHIL